MLPGRAPVRRLGAASLALSAGALLALAAPVPVTAAEPKKCVKGHDPESSITDIKCQFHNNVETIKDKLDELNGQSDKNTATDKTEKDDKTDKGATKDKDAKGTKKSSGPGSPKAPLTPRTSVRSPAGTTVRVPENFTVQAPEQVSDALPEQPRVADAPEPVQTLALPESHLVEPVASELPLKGDPERAMWAAGAAAGVTAVVMAHFSLIGARLRRRVREGG